MHFTGSSKQTPATKKESKDADESSSDYEEVDEERRALKLKASTLPARLLPSINLTYCEYT